MVKRVIKKNFQSFSYFYSYLRYRILILIILSIFVGLLDGLGLAMFLPLLHMVNDSSEMDPEALGNLSFLIELFDSLNIPMTLFAVLGIMATFFFAKGIVQYLAGVFRVDVQEWFIRNLRIRNINGLNNLAYRHFVVSDIGRIQNTLTGEIDRVAAAYFNYTKAFEALVLVAVYTGFAFYIDIQFALLVTVGGILTNFLYKSLYTKTKSLSTDLTLENSIFQSLIIQNVGNYKYLKATGYLFKYGEKLRESVIKIRNSKRRIGKIDALLTAGREPILIMVVVVVIYIQTAVFGSPLGPILMSLLFFYRALNYLIQMQLRWNKFLSVSGSLENIKAFESELKKNKEVSGQGSITDQVKQLQLEQVSFFYGKNPVLRDINLLINKNETIALVGESGSGKTTLVNIIAGLLPADKGNYTINDQPSSDIDMISFQKKIGYITQDPVIFGDDLYNNITFWSEKSEKNFKQFWKAVKQAAILDFVEELPDKENTVLGVNGINLSGGQRQRISIARELYKEVDILILDEATSALDSETEKAIQNNIEKLRGDYTFIIVAHRISTIKNADRIVVMKDGGISAIGTFGELTKSSDYFGRLVALQEI